MPFEGVQAFADHDRLGGRDDSHQDRQEDDDDNLAALGGEIGDDPARQFAVGVLAVVLFFVESFVESHKIPAGQVIR